ncbi:extracellular solute-binding protein [Georgenia halophila]|uniref:Extracellular solute-binding protein n=1 Tax=Georgenia halophila TaxID=620889 RepID=A0ABP8LCB1_9MICO
MTHGSAPIAGTLSRRRLLGLAAALTATGTTSACAMGIGTTDPAGGLTMLTYDDVETAARLREQLARFREQTGHRTTMSTVPGSGAAQFPDKLRTRILGGQSPDVWQIWGGQIGAPFVEAGLTTPLENYYEQYGWHNMLNSAGIQGMTFGGELHGVPLNVSSLGAWFDAVAFDEAGADIPTTYDELETVNERLLSSGVTPGGFGGKYGWHIMRLYEYLLEVTAGPELHDELLRGEASWDQPAVVESFDLFQKWNDRRWITNGALGVAPPDAERSFVQGTSAYTFSGPWIEAQYIIPSNRPPSEFGTFLLPTGHENVRHSGFIEGYMISSASGVPDTAAELLDFLIQPETQSALGNSQSATLAAPPDPETFPLSAKWAEIRTHSEIYTIQDQAFPKAVSDQYFAVQSQVLQSQMSGKEAAREMQRIVSEWRRSR